MSAPNETGADRANDRPGLNHKTHTEIVVDLDARRKEYETLRARAALIGCSLLKLEDGTYLLGKWGLLKEFPTIESVEEMLSRMEGV